MGPGRAEGAAFAWAGAGVGVFCAGGAWVAGVTTLVAVDEVDFARVLEERNWEATSFTGTEAFTDRKHEVLGNMRNGSEGKKEEQENKLSVQQWGRSLLSEP